MRRSTTLHLAVLAVLAAAVFATHRVWGEAAQEQASEHRVATVDILQLLEDMLQTDAYKPQRDEFRSQWEDRLTTLQNQLAQLENELRMSAPGAQNLQQLQQRYQQTAFEFQQLQREASMQFDQFSAEQAAEAYGKLHEAAESLAEELGYSHVFASRRSAEIQDRGNLATVTQEILARPALRSPEQDDLTARLRQRMDIPAVEADIGAEGVSVDDPAAADAPDEEDGGDSE